ARDVTPGLGYVARGPRTYPPAITVPSEMLDAAAERGLETPTASGVAPPVATGSRSARAADGQLDLFSAAHTVALERHGERIVLAGSPDMQLLGEAIHGFLAADRPEIGDDERRAIAAGLLRRWGVASALRPDDLLRASDRLRAWVEGRLPGAVWH